MIICLVSREYPSDDHAGGIGTYTEKTARTLAGMGHTVTVITEAVGAASSRMEDGVQVHRLAPAGLAGPVRLPYMRTLARARAVDLAVRRLPATPDVVQVCESGAEGFWYSLRDHPGSKLLTRLATPTFVVAELSANAGHRVMRARYMDRIERSQTRRSDAIISPSAALADIVCERWQIPRERITIVPTGVDFAERFAGAGVALPAELRDREYLLYFGRLEERKGVHVLADALPEVLAAHPSLHAVFAGENFLTYRGEPMQAYVEHRNREHRDRLHFLPRLPQAQLHPLLAGSLLVVLPSLWESLANAALEALDMGKPVVATTGCGFAEVVEDGRSGLLVAPGDAAQLRDVLLLLIAGRDRLRRMSEAARARAESFRLPRVVTDLVAVYERLVPSPAGRAR